MKRLRRFLYIGGAFILLLIKFTIDVISKSNELTGRSLGMIRELSVIGAFVLLVLALWPLFSQRERPVLRQVGFLLLITFAALFSAVAASQIVVGGFERKNLALLPLDYQTLFVSSFVSILLGVFAVVALLLLNSLVLYRPRKGTKRNFLLLTGTMAALCASVLVLRPLDDTALTTGLFILAAVFAVINSFRLPWIVFLTKREKILVLVFAFLLFTAFTALNVLLSRDGLVRLGLLFFSYPLKQFVVITALFGNVYFGMAFVSTLFHLPTADAFDRKRSEVTSLHSLSRLITQVFDFDELVQTVTSMTQQVCEAKSCWLELVQEQEGQKGMTVQAIKVVAMKNVTIEDIQRFHPPDGRGVQGEVLQHHAPVVVDDVARDSRLRHLRKAKVQTRSVVVMPLVSHSDLIGILYATKDEPFGFVKDDVDVISAFADQATVAIENARLIKENIERERLSQEMMLARDMQRKLLPQEVPCHACLELDAISTPAFEVGGDYYDFIRLDDDRLGIVVGDVSGKGVPAAFYMSEVKGIFQSLSKLYPSPREFLIRANEVLVGTVDRRSFISLLFAVLDLRTGVLTHARAGHCPMLVLGKESTAYIRPNGMGLGLSGDAVFSDSLQEETFALQAGDVCVFYTDGVTEARKREEEFGYERLLAAARTLGHLSAEGIKDGLMTAVRDFTEHEVYDDDITLVVLKWKGIAT